jgi:hypothetical protein
LLLISIALLSPHHRVALSWQVENDGRRGHLSAGAGVQALAGRQISNDRKSGERRSARLERRTLRRDKNEIEIVETLDGS